MPTKYVAIGAAVLILGVAAYFLMMGKGDTTSSTTDDQSGSPAEQTATETDGAFTGSLTDLVKRGGDYKCTFSSATAEAKTSGTVYVSGARVRGDFSSDVPAAGGSVESHMIQSDGYVYSWTSAAPFGFKAKAATGASSSGGATSGQYADMNTSYGYNCTRWSVDSSMFVVPSGIKFMGQ